MRRGSPWTRRTPLFFFFGQKHHLPQHAMVQLQVQIANTPSATAHQYSSQIRCQSGLSPSNGGHNCSRPLAVTLKSRDRSSKYWSPKAEFRKIESSFSKAARIKSIPSAKSSAEICVPLGWTSRSSTRVPSGKAATESATGRRPPTTLATTEAVASRNSSTPTAWMSENDRFTSMRKRSPSRGGMGRSPSAMTALWTNVAEGGSGGSATARLTAHATDPGGHSTSRYSVVVAAPKRPPARKV
mmetsp:Transcript_26330/g.75961  ORF Transcript_26330/g.75961 Transcript_26330/m.75961 type:complete len:242 (-) Transcript_26330:388-1113(-)